MTRDQPLCGWLTEWFAGGPGGTARRAAPPPPRQDRRVEGTRTPECTRRSDFLSALQSTCPGERRGQVVGKIRRDREPFPRGRMHEAQAMRMQELALEPQIAADAVLRIPRDGQIYRGEVNPNLVRSACLQAHVEERLLRPRRGEAPGRGGIEPMDDARPIGIISTSSPERQELPRERPRALACARV